MQDLKVFYCGPKGRIDSKGVRTGVGVIQKSRPQDTFGEGMGSQVSRQPDI